MPTDVKILTGDCRELLATLPENSLDACVTDAPYGLEFMGKEWDAPWKGDVRQPGDGNYTEGPGPYGRAKVRYGMAPSYGGSQAGGGFSKPSSQLQMYQVWAQEWAEEILRVLKPGAYALVFGGTRTSHRLACALEDAGFEIRDSLMWLYGTGFPKSLDVSKALDNAAGAAREVVRTEDRRSDYDRCERQSAAVNTNWRAAEGREDVRDVAIRVVTAPATDAARQWQGWGTALKPGWEPIILARKPLCGSVAENVTRYGVGGINVDGCRIDAGGETWTREPNTVKPNPSIGTFQTGTRSVVQNPSGRWPANVVLSHTPECVCVGTKPVKVGTAVRANGASGFSGGLYRGGEMGAGPDAGYADADGLETVEDWRCAPDCPVRLLDEQGGERRSAGNYPSDSWGTGNGVTYGGKKPQGQLYSDSGGASRFFYCAKASRRERDLGCEALPAASRDPSGLNVKTAQCRVCGNRAKTTGQGAPGPNCGHNDWEWVEQIGGARTPMAGRGQGGLKCTACGKWKVSGNPCTCADPQFEKQDFARPTLRNTHPTVKPLALMRWLVRLVTPPGGTVLDPFLGSGTTALACRAEGFNCIGIEQNPEYVQIAEARLGAMEAEVEEEHRRQPSLFEGGDDGDCDRA